MDLKQPVVVSNPHPLIGDGRTFSYERFLPSETLGEYIDRNNVQIPRSAIQVFINGQLIFGDWEKLTPTDGDQIVFAARAQGGGGGGKVLRIVAMVAVIIAAPYVGGAIAGSSFGAALGISSSLATGLVMVAGSLVVNALLPYPKPQSMGVADKEQSPTYGINAGRNQSSPYNPMPLVFGRHKIVPFLASKPYTTFVGNDQFLSQAFHFGLQPDLKLTDVKIGDTLLSNFLDVEVNRSEYDGKLSLVSGNVDTLDGFELHNSDGWVQRTTPLDTEHISADIAATLHDIADDGGERKVSVRIESQYRVAGATNWMPLGGTGREVATHYWSLGYWTTERYGWGDDATREVWHQVSYGSTNQSDHVNGETHQVCHDEIVWGRRVTKCTNYTWRWVRHPVSAIFGSRAWEGTAPNPYTSYSGTGISVLEGKDPQKPTRVTINESVPRGQYDIRFRKVTSDISTSRKSNKTTIAQIRCTQSDDADYTGQCRMAVRIKATSQLNGAIDELSAIASAKCPVWVNGAWVEQETSNPAWWYLFWARGKRDLEGRRLYGELLDETKIDVDAIRAWAAFCDANNLTFNWVLDRKMSIEDVYYTIARAGRASTTWSSGKRSVIWDSANAPVVTLATPDNIIAGSYSYKIINAETADEVVVNFVNKERDWEKDVVRQKIPGADRTNNSITFDLEGVDSQEQAGREANLLAASQYFHRKQHTWEMDIEGAVLKRGDVCRLTHDLTSFASSGRVLGVSGNTLSLDTDIGIVINGWLSLRAPNNEIAYLRVNSNGFNANVISWPQWFPKPTEENSIDYIWQFDPVKTPGTTLQIRSVVPQSNGNVRFEAIEYIPEYYLSEDDPFAYIEHKAPYHAINSVYSISASERIVDEAAGKVDVTFTWVLSERANVDVTIYINGEAFDVFTTGRYMTTVSAQHGDVIDIIITPHGNGSTGRYQYAVKGVVFDVPAVASLTTESQLYAVKLRWTIPQANYIERSEIWYSDNANLSTAQKLTDLAYPQWEYQHWIGQAAKGFYYWVRVVDRFGNIGGFYPAGSGVYGQSSDNLDDYTAAFKDEFLSSEVGQQMMSDIGNIETNVSQINIDLSDAQSEIADAREKIDAVESAADTISVELGETKTDLRAEIKDRKQQLMDEVALRIAGDDTQAAAALLANQSLEESISVTRDVLKAQIRENTASIIEEALVRATENEALAEKVTMLETSVGEDIAAAISVESKARSDADSALAQQIETLETDYGTNKASVQSQITALSDADTAFTQQLDSHISEYDTNKASVESSLTTLSDENSALALQIDALETSVDNANASISTESAARAAGDEALTLYIDQASSSLSGDIGDLSARIETEETTRANEVEALAGRADTIEASISTLDGELTAAIETEATARVDALSSLAQTTETLRVAGDDAQAANTLIALKNQDEALTASVSNISARFRGNEASISAESIARADADSALSAQITTLEATVNDDITAAINAESIARSTEDEALAAQIASLETSFGEDISSAINTEAAARSDADSALTQALDTHISNYESNKASVQSQITTLTNDQSSTATQLNTVQATANDAQASAQTANTAVSDIDGRLSSTITNKVQILSNGQRVQAGTGLGIESDPNGTGFHSSFNVWADRFSVWSGIGTTLTTPFTVSNGQVFMRNALITELTSANIKTRSLKATDLETGTITAASGVIGNLAVQEANIANLSVGRLKIGNNAVTTMSEVSTSGTIRGSSWNNPYNLYTLNVAAGSIVFLVLTMKGQQDPFNNNWTYGHNDIFQVLLGSIGLGGKNQEDRFEYPSLAFSGYTTTNTTLYLKGGTAWTSGSTWSAKIGILTRYK